MLHANCGSQKKTRLLTTSAQFGPVHDSDHNGAIRMFVSLQALLLYRVILPLPWLFTLLVVT